MRVLRVSVSYSWQVARMAGLRVNGMQYSLFRGLKWMMTVRGCFATFFQIKSLISADSFLKR